MIASVIRKAFGTRNGRELKRMGRIVERINALEPSLQSLADAELAATTAKLKERLAAGASLDEMLPEAFAAVREASCRVHGERPYDVQMIGGVALHEGKIAEMRTGEGKTRCTRSSLVNAMLSRK